MKLTNGLLLASILSFSASTAFASGGPVDELNLKCKSSTGQLVVVRLGQAYSSETTGDALVYSKDVVQSQMVTSLEQCVTASNAQIEPAVDSDLASNEELTVCGSREHKGDKLSIHANKKGYRLIAWRNGGAPMIRLTKDGKPVFGDVTCTEDPR